MRENTMKRILSEGGSAFGTLLSEVSNEEGVHIIAAVGYDFFVFDTEHGSGGIEGLQRRMRAASASGITPIVRVPDNEYSFISRALDSGALGVMIPRVDSAEEAEAAVEAVKYPPVGRRGYGLRGSIIDYVPATIPETIEWANNETLVIVQIESQKSLDNLEAIAAVQGVDVCLVGPVDLSISLGIPGSLNDDAMLRAIERVVAVTGKHGVAAGVHVGDLDYLLRCRDMGVRALMYATDARLLMGAAGTALQKLRGEAGTTRVSGY